MSTMTLEELREAFDEWATANAPYLNLQYPKHDERGYYWQDTEAAFKAFVGGCENAIRTRGERA